MKKPLKRKPKKYEDGGKYDYTKAAKYGITPDETGHWPTRVSETGDWLKLPGHPTLPLSIYNESLIRTPEASKGYFVGRKEDGTFYSNPRQYEGGGMMDMTSGMIPGMGIVNLAGNMQGNIETLKSDTINKAGKAQAGLNIGADALGAAASIPTPATPFLKAAEGVVRIGSSIAGAFKKEKGPEIPQKFTENYFGNFEQGGRSNSQLRTSKLTSNQMHPTLAFPGGAATPIYTIPGEVTVHDFKGKSHTKGGIMIDPSTEVEGGELNISMAGQDGSYILRREIAAPLKKKLGRLSKGAPGEFTAKALISQSIRRNEELLKKKK